MREEGGVLVLWGKKPGVGGREEGSPVGVVWEGPVGVVWEGLILM